MIKIVLVDDHQVIIDGLRLLLPTLIKCEISGTSTSASDAIKLIKETKPDLVFLDLVMPGELNGIDALYEIRNLNTPPRVLILSMLSDEYSINRVFEIGFDGYLIKNASGQEIVKAISTVMNDEVYIHPELEDYFSSHKEKLSLKKKNGLSTEELETLKKLSQGLTTKEIAEVLFISEEAIRSRRKKLMKKLNCNNTAELVSFAIRNHLLS